MKLAVACLVVGSIGALSLPAQESQYPLPDDVRTIDGVIRASYESVSGARGVARQWERDASLFLPNATITSMWINSSGEPVTRTVTHEEYRENADWSSVGFFETEVSREVQMYGRMAHVWSTYEYRLAEDGPIRGRGINSFQLVHDGERWWIRGLMFNSEGPEEPLPPEYTRVPHVGQSAHAGTYQVTGTYPDNSAYEGSVTLVDRADGGIDVRWDVQGAVFTASLEQAGAGRFIGRFEGDFSGYAHYWEAGDGRLRGRWWSDDYSASAREVWSR